MTDRKYRVWLDSGANIHSCHSQIINLSDIGFTAEEFDALTPDEQEQEMRMVAFEKSDWGFTPVDDGEDEE